MFNIPIEWKWVRIDDVKASGRSIVSGPFGSNIGRRFFVTEGVPVIRGNNLTTDYTKFIDDGFVFVTEEKASKLSNCQAVPGDLVFTAAGSLGQVGLIPGSPKYSRYIISNKQMRARLDSNLIDNEFAFYWLSSPWMVNFIQQRNTGSSVPLINLSVLRSLPLPLPPLKEQKEIVAIINSLDEKVELNHRINQNLEAMAQTLFQSWFVDFEPFRDGEFVESELGLIPRGWRVGNFSELVKEMIGGDWGKAEQQKNHTQKVYCIRGADIPELRIGNEGKVPIRYILEKNLKKKRLNPGDIVIEISGGSPTQSTGRVTYINSELLSRFDSSVVCTNFCRVVSLKNVFYSEFVYLYLRYLYKKDVFFQFENGTTGIKNLDINNLFEVFKIVVPPESVVSQFKILVQSIFDFIQRNGIQNGRLSAIRDNLLPKLMSGGIRVPLDEKEAAHERADGNEAG